MEFYRPGIPAGQGPRHITVGIGLHCSRNQNGETGQPVTFWGFGVRDGRRVGSDFDLADPLTGTSLRRQDLEAVLGEGGTVVTTVHAYRRLVNDLLFGFPDVAEYRQLLDLLLEVRTPKLNRDMRPGLVSELLAEALPPVERGLFDQMRAILERIDDYVDSCTQLRRRFEAVSKLDDAVARVQWRQTELAALRYDTARRTLEGARGLAEAAGTALAEAQAALAAAEGDVGRLEQRTAEVEGELDALRESAALRADEALGAARERAYAGAGTVAWPGCVYRRDIGPRG
jgi:hypothetical protein